jgi:hypothetical protein
LNEQYGNVIENKGATLTNRQISGNVIGKKGSYALRAGMLLKGKEVGGKGRFQVSGLRIQGRKAGPALRTSVSSGSGVRSQNEADLLPAFWPLLTAGCPLPLDEVRIGGLLGWRRSPRQDVILSREKGCGNFKN